MRHEAGREVLEAIKPRLRGWLHAGAFPVAITAGIILVALGGSPTARTACAIYAITAIALFGVSALYHRGQWSPRTQAVLRRLDHANIFLIIAGTYTPFTLLLLEGAAVKILLSTVWAGALVGIVVRTSWGGAPRWLFAPVYLALGWAAVFYLPQFFQVTRPIVFGLLVAGGVLYSVGAVIYATKRPNPSPRWFGFHEVFHAFTLAAYASHYVAIVLVAAAYSG